MRKSRRLGPSLVLISLVVFASPARAGSANDPEILDAVGDANIVSTWGQAGSTEPASLAELDISALWFTTAISTSPNGTSHVDGLNVYLKTAASVTGPLPVVFNIPIQVDDCDFNLRVAQDVKLSSTGDLPDYTKTPIAMLSTDSHPCKQYPSINYAPDVTVSGTTVRVFMRFTDMEGAAFEMFRTGAVLNKITTRPLLNWGPNTGIARESIESLLWTGAEVDTAVYTRSYKIERAN
jgi:hypothetical protein